MTGSGSIRAGTTKDAYQCPTLSVDGLDRIWDARRLMESNRHTGKIVVRV
ncbi:hypothetical protein ACFWIO_17055 [Streptomyces diastatochromogenes]